MRNHIITVLTTIVLTSAAAYAAETGTFRIRAPGVNPAMVSQLQADLVLAEEAIEGALGSFGEPVTVEVYDSRDDFTRALDRAWGLSRTSCWMVGGADHDQLFLLSPDAWSEQACEHDGDDPDHVRRLVTHEAVHALHDQVNRRDLGELTDLAWLVEGLATYVSGQWATEHAGRDFEAVLAGHSPDCLTDAWSGPYRYGVAGSMVAFIDAEWGHYHLRSLLSATSTVDAMDALGVTEAEFLDRWERWVLTL